MQWLKNMTNSICHTFSRAISCCFGYALTATEMATICGYVQFGQASICAHVNQKTITNKPDNVIDGDSHREADI